MRDLQASQRPLGHLEEAGYITVSKTFEGRMPRTTYSLTEVGREQLDEYWRMMDEIRAGGAARLGT